MLSVKNRVFFAAFAFLASCVVGTETTAGRTDRLF
jgi:hypothetical protein